MAACKIPMERNWTNDGSIPVSAECGPVPLDCSWQDCENLNVPQRSAWIGEDICENNIQYEDDWCGGNNGLGQVISGAIPCGIDSGVIVPTSNQVLYSADGIDGDCRRGCHRRSRSHSCRSRDFHHHNVVSDCISSSDECGGNTSQIKTKTCSSNENKVFTRSLKSSSKSCSSSIKKSSANQHHDGSHPQKCQYVQTTRMVPKVTVQPKVRYIPQVTNERIVSYVPQTCVNEICEPNAISSTNFIETCGPNRVDECRHESKCKEAIICQRSRCGRVDECRHEPRCKEAIICQRSRSEDRCNKSNSCESRSSRKIRCW